MMTDGDTVSTSDRQRRYARVAGVALLVICLSGVLSNDLVVPGDAAATARNILGHERWFRIGLAGELLMVNADVVVAVALYALLKPVNAPLAMLGMLWRFANVLLQGVGIVVSLVALDCLGDAHYRIAFTASQLQATARQLLDIHGTAMGVGLVFFGLGAAVHAYLLWTSRYVPRVLSGAYIVVTALILLSCSAVIIFPNLETVIDPWLIAPDFFVEFAVALWLTIKGANIAQTPRAFGI